MQILITGASGFVGTALATRLAAEAEAEAVTGADIRLHLAVRDPARLPAALRTDSIRHHTVAALDAQTDWQAAVAGAGVVVHCAARVHVMDETAADPLAAFRRVNVEGSLHLARQARAAGVRRFVFVSSIKVNGEQTGTRPFHADDTPAPQDAYGQSKLEAEQALLALGREGPMEVVVVRPVLVYGPGVKANFLSMMRWLDKGVPLPLGGITANRRSLVALDNLVDLLVLCTRHPQAAGQVFLAADGEDLSTTALLRGVAQALGKPARLLPVPAALLTLAARLLGKPGVAQRLCGSLQADIGKNREVLGWTPPFSVGQALAKTVAAYRTAGN